MPSFRKLQEEEVKRKGKGESQRVKTVQEYDRYLDAFAPNEYGEAVVDEAAGEKKLTVRNRLKAAAERRHWNLEFLRTSGNAIRFHITAGVAAPSNGENGSRHGEEAEQFRQAEEPSAPEPKARRRRGKQAAAEEEKAFTEAPAEG